MNKWILTAATALGALLLLLVFSTITLPLIQSTIPPVPAAVPVAEADPSAVPKIEFDGVTWTLVGQLAPSDIERSVGRRFKAHLYNSARAEQRLIRLDMLPSFPDGSVGGIAQMTFVQVNENGSWINTGLDEQIGPDGVRIVTHQVDGTLHGTYAVYYTNGQLKLEQRYVNGQRQGKGRGFYEDGQPQWEADYKDDREVSGKSWDKEGKPN